MDKDERFLKWTTDLQRIAQAGLQDSSDVFDRERYEELNRVADEMIRSKIGLPEKRVDTLFLGNEWYKTPKLDTRAAIFKNNKILLVKERMSQTWSLPGGWNDYDCTTAENCIKEAREESGRIVKPIKIIAVLDRNHHNKPIRKTNITKIFYLCQEIDGRFEANDETDACGYFALDNLPKLSLGRNTEEQIAMCFKAKDDPDWKTRFE